MNEQLYTRKVKCTWEPKRCQIVHTSCKLCNEKIWKAWRRQLCPQNIGPESLYSTPQIPSSESNFKQPLVSRFSSVHRLRRRCLRGVPRQLAIGTKIICSSVAQVDPKWTNKHLQQTWWFLKYLRMGDLKIIKTICVWWFLVKPWSFATPAFWEKAFWILRCRQTWINELWFNWLDGILKNKMVIMGM